MNPIPHTDRARITAIIARLISELAGSDPELDQVVAAIISDLIGICCRSKMLTEPDHGHAECDNALRLISEKDWLLTVRKVGDSFQFEAKFGTDIKTATLHQSLHWLSEAGTN